MNSLDLQSIRSIRLSVCKQSRTPIILKVNKSIFTAQNGSCPFTVDLIPFLFDREDVQQRDSPDEQQL